MDCLVGYPHYDWDNWEMSSLLKDRFHKLNVLEERVLYLREGLDRGMKQRTVEDVAKLLDCPVNYVLTVIRDLEDLFEGMEDEVKDLLWRKRLEEGGAAGISNAQQLRFMMERILPEEEIFSLPKEMRKEDKDRFVKLCEKAERLAEKNSDGDCKCMFWFPLPTGTFEDFMDLEAERQERFLIGLYSDESESLREWWDEDVDQEEIWFQVSIEKREGEWSLSIENRSLVCSCEEQNEENRLPGSVDMKMLFELLDEKLGEYAGT
jgi:hypothetical protein